MNDTPEAAVMAYAADLARVRAEGLDRELVIVEQLCGARLRTALRREHAKLRRRQDAEEVTEAFLMSEDRAQVTTNGSDISEFRHFVVRVDGRWWVERVVDLCSGCSGRGCYACDNKGGSDCTR